MSVSYVVLRFLLIILLMLLSGSMLSSCLLAPAPLGQRLQTCVMPYWRVGVSIVLIATVLGYLLQCASAGNGWQDGFSPTIWLALSGTGMGKAWLWQFLFALGTVLFICSGRTSVLAGLICLLLQMAGFASIGHAAMGEGYIGVILNAGQVVHLLAAGWWTGGLLPVVMSMAYARQPEWRKSAITALVRFSHYGHLAVALVLLTGVTDSLLIVGPNWTWSSDYVRLLLFKVGLVAVMVGIALYNRYWLVPRFRREGQVAWAHFVSLTRVELGLAVAVILLACIFASLEP